MSTLILFNKPFQVMSQFSPAADKATLADYIPIPGVYPAGRLDYDSEGLLVLTNDGRLQHRISHPRAKLPKTYWVQVEGEITDAALAELSSGVELKDGRTRPAIARHLTPPDWLWPRHPPVRFRRHIPTSWLTLTLREGRNRQVRRMTAAVGFPTLRLIRYAVGDWTLEGLVPGAWRKLEIHVPAPRPDNAEQPRRSNRHECKMDTARHRGRRGGKRR